MWTESLMWNQDDHRDLAELCREDDKLRAEREWMAHRKSKAGPQARKNGDGGARCRDDDEYALVHAPVVEREASYEEPGLNGTQLEELAHVVAELHKEFDAAIERTQQRILQTVVRLVMPGEFAEQKVQALSDRVALVESQIERRISKALTDQGVIDLPRDFWKRHAS